MKKLINKITEFIKKYLPDVIITIGAGILSYNIFRPPIEYGLKLPSFVYTDYHLEEKVLGIILIIIGLDIAIRRYISYKKKRDD